MDVKENYSDKKMFARIILLQKLRDNKKLEYDIVKDKIIDRAMSISEGGILERIYKRICLKKKKLRKVAGFRGKINSINLSILEFLEKLFVKRILREKKKSVLPYYMKLYSKMDSLSNSINDYEKEIRTITKNINSGGNGKTDRAILVIGKRRNIVKKAKYSYTWDAKQNSDYIYDTMSKARRK